MIQENYELLINKLIEGTNLKKVVWNKTSNPKEYQTVIGSGIITVSCNSSKPDLLVRYKSGDVCLTIWNDNGDIIDQLKYSITDPGFAQLKNLYDCARRAYLKIDDTISDILRHLDF